MSNRVIVRSFLQFRNDLSISPRDTVPRHIQLLSTFSLLKLSIHGATCHSNVRPRIAIFLLYYKRTNIFMQYFFFRFPKLFPIILILFCQSPLRTRIDRFDGILSDRCLITRSKNCRTICSSAVHEPCVLTRPAHHTHHSKKPKVRQPSISFINDRSRYRNLTLVKRKHLPHR